MTLWLLVHHFSRSWALAAAGFTFALAAGARANLFLVLPCLSLWLMRINRGQWRVSVKSAGCPEERSGRGRFEFFAALSLGCFATWLRTRNMRKLFQCLTILVVLCLICWPDWLNLARRKSARQDFFIGKHYFFSLQAKFPNGTVYQEAFRPLMGDTPAQNIAAEYMAGLKHWMNADTAAAAQAFERCLQINAGKKPRSRYSPQKWPGKTSHD